MNFILMIVERITVYFRQLKCFEIEIDLNKSILHTATEVAVWRIQLYHKVQVQL